MPLLSEELGWSTGGIDGNPFSALDESVIDSVPQMIWLMTQGDSTLERANSAFFTYFGAISADREDRRSRYHPVDRLAVRESFAKAQRDRLPFECEIRMLRADDCYRWHKLVARPLPADAAGRWLMTAFDVDEIVAARERLREAIDISEMSQVAAGAGTWELDLRCGVVKLSRENARLHGIADCAVELDLDGWKAAVEPDDAATALERVESAVATRDIFKSEFRVRGLDGAQRWLGAIGRAYYGEDGSPLRMIGLNFDITERKMFETQLLAANDRAESARRDAVSASEAKSDFLAAMSHEIRTPLNSILGFTDLMLDRGELTGELRRFAEIIASSGAALLTVIDDVLDFSKIEAGRIEIEAATFVPRALFADAISIVGGLASGKHLEIVSSIDAKLPQRLVGDMPRIRQVVLNLLNNAVKFTTHGSVSLDVHVEGSTGSTIRLKVSVTDTGIGIDRSQQDRLFQRFSQADASISRRYGGSGLGLAICKRLIEQMGGEIGVRSEAGKGSTFWFTLQLETKTPADVPTAHPAAGAILRGKLLLVEDIEVNQILARTLLEAGGHRVDVAVSGEDAIAKVTSDRYDLVLMDVQMPGMDGITATRDIRSRPGFDKLPIIAMTANVMSEQVREFLAAGMNDHIGKPIKKADMLATIQRWLQAIDSAQQ